MKNNSYQVGATVTTIHRFLDDAAHELRTPLTALRTNLDLALDENNAADRALFLVRAQAMVARLEELITNLLEFSRLESNVDFSGKAIIDLTELLGQRIEIWASRAEQAELIFEADLPNIPVFIRGDVSQIVCALNHLIDNAFKFTPREGTVRVAVSRQSKHAVFSIMDTGIGIPADDLAQLFNRFHRARNAAAYLGSGLGLAIVQAIVTAHAALVEVHSAGEGKGSRFAIKFPPVLPQHL